MARKIDDGPSIDRVRLFLKMFDCPDARLAQGAPEWAAAQGEYRMTPDLVAGPIKGGSDHQDFLIDVWEPTGDWFVKPAGDSPKAAAVVLRAVRESGTFNFEEIADDGIEGFLNPLNKKVRKYSGSRGWSIMCGLAMYFNLRREGSDIGKVTAFHQSIDAIDRVFGISHECGNEATLGLIRSAMTQEDPVRFVCFPFPEEYRITFLLWCADVDRQPAAFLFANRRVTHPEFGWKDHPVVRWLARLERAKDHALTNMLFAKYLEMPVRE